MSTHRTPAVSRRSTARPIWRRSRGGWTPCARAAPSRSPRSRPRRRTGRATAPRLPPGRTASSSTPRTICRSWKPGSTGCSRAGIAPGCPARSGGSGRTATRRPGTTRRGRRSSTNTRIAWCSWSAGDGWAPSWTAGPKGHGAPRRARTPGGAGSTRRATTRRRSTGSSTITTRRRSDCGGRGRSGWSRSCGRRTACGTSTGASTVRWTGSRRRCAPGPPVTPAPWSNGCGT